MIVATASWRSRKARLCGNSEQRGECCVFAEKAGLQVKKLRGAGVYRGYSGYLHSSQNATALAAATFRESTPCIMGMRIV